MLNLAALDEQVLAQPKFADHPAWKDRADRAITAADKLLFQRLDHDGVIALWEAFWAVVPDAWMEANTWAALAARNQAVLAYLQSLAADEPLDIVAMQTAYFAAAPDPAPQLRPHFMEVRE